MTLPPPITSKSNVRVKALRTAFSGAPSDPGDLLGIEGVTLIAEATRSGLHFDTIFVREGSQAAVANPELVGVQAREWIVLSPEAFASAVDTVSPQGIAATFALPPVVPPTGKARGVFLVLEGLQDPGNMGTLLRSAEAFGIKHIFATTSTVSMWNPKAVRASAGSVFRMPVTRMSLGETKRWLSERDVCIFAAVAQAEGAKAAMDVDLAQSCALLLGNEGAGLSSAALAFADELIHIPCMTESLNVAIAGSTLMYEALRQRRAETDQQTPPASK